MQSLLAFLALMLPLTLSPGPATITLAGLGLSQGLLRSLPFYFGLQLSTFMVALAAGLGLNEIFLSYPLVYETLHYAGILYILYLALKFLRARPSVSESGESSAGFGEGFLFTLLNPKFYLLVTVVFSQFLQPGADTVWALILGLTAIVAFSSFIWLAAGAGLRPLLRSARALRIQSVTFGLLLAAVALTMLLQGL